MGTPVIPYSEFVGNEDPFPIMRSTPGHIAKLSEHLTPEQLETAPQPGKWSLHQIVAHLADCELMFQVRVRLILFEDEPRLAAFDQDRWANGWVREDETWQQTFERFRTIRESTVRLLENIPEQDLRRIGIHSERGPQTPADYIILIAGHDLNHLHQIETIHRTYQGGRS